MKIFCAQIRQVYLYSNTICYYAIEKSLFFFSSYERDFDQKSWSRTGKWNEHTFVRTHARTHSTCSPMIIKTCFYHSFSIWNFSSAIQLAAVCVRSCVEAISHKSSACVGLKFIIYNKTFALCVRVCVRLVFSPHRLQAMCIVVFTYHIQTQQHVHCDDRWSSITICIHNFSSIHFF